MNIEIATRRALNVFAQCDPNQYVTATVKDCHGRPVEVPQRLLDAMAQEIIDAYDDGYKAAEDELDAR